MATVLVVDDESAICWGLSQLGEGLGHEVVTTSSAEEALQLLDTLEPNVVVLDVRLPGMDGLTALGKIQERLPTVPVILITAFGDLDTAVEAVRLGAFEYLVKPFDLDNAQRALKRALERVPATPLAASNPSHSAGLVGSSTEIQEVFKQIALAAAADACVLVSGESGTGKELVARAIHRYSGRSHGPFVAVNIASLSPTLMESELFGHVRGAFTGADRARPGLLARADQGTLFLDEIAEIPTEVQVKLLRALEHGEVLPVGSSEPARTDFRIVSASHRHLLDLVKAGTFRHDLYFRLCTYQITIPPLRDRMSDVEELARHFVQLRAVKAGSPPPQLPDETIEVLQKRPWFGNVRELRNAMEHAVMVARGGTILPEHLPPPVSQSLFGQVRAISDLETELQELVGRWSVSQLGEGADSTAEAGNVFENLLRIVEPPLLAEALKNCKGQCAGAARKLGMHRTTLRKKLDQYGIEAE